MINLKNIFSSISFNTHFYYLICIAFGLVCAYLVSKNKKAILAFIFGFLTGPIALIYYLVKSGRSSGDSAQEQDFMEKSFDKISQGAKVVIQKSGGNKLANAAKNKLMGLSRKIGAGPVVTNKTKKS